MGPAVRSPCSPVRGHWSFEKAVEELPEPGARVVVTSPQRGPQLPAVTDRQRLSLLS